MAYTLTDSVSYPGNSTDSNNYSIDVDLDSSGLNFQFELDQAETISFYVMFLNIITESGQVCNRSLSVVDNVAGTLGSVSDSTLNAWVKMGPFTLSPGQHEISLSGLIYTNTSWPSGTTMCYISNLVIGPYQINLESWFSNQDGPLESWVDTAPAENYALLLNDPQQNASLFGPLYNFGTGDFTLEAWVSTTVGGPIFSFIDVPSQPVVESLLFAIESDGSLVFGYQTVLASWYGFWDGGPVLDSEWHHVAVVRQGPSVQAYLDGELLSPPQTNSSPLTTPMDLSGATNCHIGLALTPNPSPQSGEGPIGWALSNYAFQGMIDEVRFWQAALPQDVIAEGMHHQLTNKEPGLGGHWTFDNQDGTDSSVSSINLMGFGQISYAPS
jgi:hypothetical protein